MSRLIIMTVPELLPGYRLAGAATVQVSSAAEAQTRLAKLLATEDGVIAVHAGYYNLFPAAFRRHLDTITAPLVVPLPAGAAATEAEDRRDQLLELLRQAVGYGITFGTEGNSP